MNIGVLAVQGAFAEHRKMLSGLGVDSFEIRQRRDILKSMDGVIIPGGESTVMGKLLRELDMLDELKSLIEGGLPTFGTCAGMILLARRIDNGDAPHLAAMDISVVRNAYGRQLGSFNARAAFGGMGDIDMVFIRAPYISQAGEKVEVLSRVEGRIVAARQGNCLATAFHPELTSDAAVHKYFVGMVDR